MKMLRSMKDFPSKVFSNANLKMDRMNLYEIFINMYLQETRQLVKRGIKSAYVGVEDNLTVYKGKLFVNQHIKNNLTHKERFYVGYDEYQVNRAENRLVKSTLLKMQKLTSSTENAKEMDCFWCEVIDGELKLLEAEAAKWLTKETLYDVRWLPADITLVEKIKEQMN